MDIHVIEQKFDRWTPLRLFGFAISGGILTVVVIGEQIRRWYNFLRI